MSGPKPPAIELTFVEKQELEKLVKRHNVGQQIALRGRIVLATAEGKNNSQIAREIGVQCAYGEVGGKTYSRSRWLI